jgi:hypothetical protein
MSHPKLVFVLAVTLILISLLGHAVPTTSAAPSRSALQMREQTQIDAHIHARMQAAIFRAWPWASYAARRLSTSKGMALRGLMGGA